MDERVAIHLGSSALRAALFSHTLGLPSSSKPVLPVLPVQKSSSARKSKASVGPIWETAPQKPVHAWCKTGPKPVHIACAETIAQITSYAPHGQSLALRYPACCASASVANGTTDAGFMLAYPLQPGSRYTLL